MAITVLLNVEFSNLFQLTEFFKILLNISYLCFSIKLSVSIYLSILFSDNDFITILDNLLIRFVIFIFMALLFYVSEIFTNISDNLLANISNSKYFMFIISSAVLNKRIIFASVKLLTLVSTLLVIDSYKYSFIHFVKLFKFCFIQSFIVIVSHVPLFNLSKTLLDDGPN